MDEDRRALHRRPDTSAAERERADCRQGRHAIALEAGELGYQRRCARCGAVERHRCDEHGHQWSWSNLGAAIWRVCGICRHEERRPVLPHEHVWVVVTRTRWRDLLDPERPVIRCEECALEGVADLRRGVLQVGGRLEQVGREQLEQLQRQVAARLAEG